MSKNLFREKSLEKITSPEDLNSYLRITNPSIWFIIVSVIILLVGAIVWGIFGKVESSVNGVAMSKGGAVACYVSEKYISQVKEGDNVVIDGVTYSIKSIEYDAKEAKEELQSDYVMTLGNFEKGENVYSFIIDGTPKTGNFVCKIVVEKISPISFLFNDAD